MESVQPATIGRESLLTTIWALTGSATAFFITRIGIRKKFTAQIWLDDWISAAATGFLFAQALITTLMVDSMYETLRYANTKTMSIPLSEQDLGALSIMESFSPAMQSFMRSQFAQMICFWTCTWLVKASFLTLSFRLLPNHLRFYTIAWFIIAGITALFYVISIISFPIACSVLAPPFCSGGHSINLSQVSLELSTALDIITNICIILLPIAVAFRANLPLRTKITIVAIFSSITIVVIMSILRLSISDGDGSDWPEVTALNLWSAIEAGLAVIIVNVVEFKLLFSINPVHRPQSTSNPLIKQRISTLPPTVRTSILSPRPQSQPGLSTPLPMTPRDARQRASIVPYRRSAQDASAYRADPGTRTLSPPVFSDVSDVSRHSPAMAATGQHHSHLRPPSSSAAASSEGPASRRWSDASSRGGMEHVVISHALDELPLGGSSSVQTDLHAVHTRMLRLVDAVEDLDAPLSLGASLHDSAAPGEVVLDPSVHGEGNEEDDDDDALDHLVIQGRVSSSEPDEADAGLEGYDLGGLSYYLPATPEASRVSFYNL